MPVRTPLVIGSSGHPEQLQAGDSLSTGGGGGVSILNDNATAGPVYPLFFTGTGSTGTLYQSNGGLSYYPVTGGLESKVHLAISPGTGDPTAASGKVIFGARSVAQRVMPIAMEPTGPAYPLQGHFSRKNIRAWRFGAATGATTLAATIGAITITSTGTITVGTPSTGNPFTRSLVSTGTTAGTVVTTRCPTANVGAVVAGARWHYSAMFGVNQVTTAASAVNAFVGLFDTNAAPASFDPTTSSLNGKLGMGFSGTANNWQVINNVAATAPTLTALTSGSGRYSVNAINKFFIDIWSDGTNYYWQIVATNSTGLLLDINTGTFSSNRPASGALLYPLFYITNGNIAGAQIMEYMHMTIETDA